MSEAGGRRGAYELRLPLPERLECLLCYPVGVPWISTGSRQGAVFAGSSRKGDLCKHLHLFHGITATDIVIRCGTCGFVGGGRYALKSVNAHMAAAHGVPMGRRPPKAASGGHETPSPIAGRTRARGGIRAMMINAQARAERGNPGSQRRRVPSTNAAVAAEATAATPPPLSSTSAPLPLPEASISSSGARAGASSSPATVPAQRSPPASTTQRPLTLPTARNTVATTTAGAYTPPPPSRTCANVPRTSEGSRSKRRRRRRERIEEEERDRRAWEEASSNWPGRGNANASIPGGSANAAATTPAAAATTRRDAPPPTTSSSGAGARRRSHASDGTEPPSTGANNTALALAGFVPPDAATPSRGVHAPPAARRLIGQLNPEAAAFTPTTRPGVTYAAAVAGDPTPSRSPPACGPTATIVPATARVAEGTTTSGSPTACTTTTMVYSSPRVSPKQQELPRTPPPSWGPKGLSMPLISPPSSPEAFYTPTGLIGVSARADPRNSVTPATPVPRLLLSPRKDAPPPPPRGEQEEEGWRTAPTSRRRGGQRGSPEQRFNFRATSTPLGAMTPPTPRIPPHPLDSGRAPPSADRTCGLPPQTPPSGASGLRIVADVPLPTRVTVLRANSANKNINNAKVHNKEQSDSRHNSVNSNNNNNKNSNNNKARSRGASTAKDPNNNNNRNKIGNNISGFRGRILVNPRFDLREVRAAIEAAASAQRSGAGECASASECEANVASASVSAICVSECEAVGAGTNNIAAEESEDEFDAIVELIDRSGRTGGGTNGRERMDESVPRPTQSSKEGGGTGSARETPVPSDSQGADPPNGEGRAEEGAEGLEGASAGGRGREDRATANDPTEEQISLMSLASLASSPEELEELATFTLRFLLSKQGPDNGPRAEGNARRPARNGGRRRGDRHNAEGRVNPSGGMAFGLPRAERERWTAAARRTQFLYKTSRRRVMREMLGGPGRCCQSGIEEAHRHFSRTHGVQGAGDCSRLPFPVEAPDPESCDQLVRPFDAVWVAFKLRKMSNSAPGPDGITYARLRRADPGCHVLTAVYNACLRLARIPRGWRSSATVLLFKKGDPRDLDSWRPIAMGDTVAKLLAALVADRLTAWAIFNGRLSPAQKGFLQYEGCLEHNFVLREAIDNANREKREIAVSWLDLSNAFGSIPHETIWMALRRHGVPATILDLIRSAYVGATTTIRVAEGTSEPVQILAGVRQGCPLSPIIFNLTLEPVIRAIEGLGKGYEFWGIRVNSLFYADDGALVAASAAGLQAALDVADETATALGLRFNPSKCASLHLAGSGGPRVRDTWFAIRGEAMRVLGPGESYSHLGTPTGYRAEQTPYASIQEVVGDVDKIDRSLLAPWQKLDAVATFILPRLDFCMRGSAVAKGPLAKADKVLKRAAKGWLNLPRRASPEVVFLPPSMGGGGLLPMADMVDALTVAHAFRMLNAEDAVVSALARSSLDDTVRRRLGARYGPEDTAAYLSGSLEGRLAGPSSDTASFWSRARNAARRLSSKLGLTWRWTKERAELAIECTDVQGGPVIIPPTAKGQVIGRLRSAVVGHYRGRLLAKPDQGKVYRVTVRNGVSNHFLRDGRFLRFADWRFLHRARLDVLPLNATKRWQLNADERCRRCGASRETLPHVLQHCGPHFAAIQRRHDAVLDRLVVATHAEGEIKVNQGVRGVTGDNARLRPDLVVRDEARRRVTIIDVAVPFENEPQALEESRERKLQAYASLAQELRGQGYAVTVDAFIVGSLGGWFTANEAVMGVLGVHKRYASKLRKLMICDAIRWSRDIYVEHMTGERQYAELQ